MHLGSCVDNIRILNLVATLANTIGVDISDLSVTGTAPAWYSKRDCHHRHLPRGIGHHHQSWPLPPITGSMKVVKLLTEGLKGVVAPTFFVVPDPEKAAFFLRRHIESKRKTLEWPADEVLYNRPAPYTLPGQSAEREPMHGRLGGQCVPTPGMPGWPMNSTDPRND